MILILVPNRGLHLAEVSVFQLTESISAHY